MKTCEVVASPGLVLSDRWHLETAVVKVARTQFRQLIPTAAYSDIAHLKRSERWPHQSDTFLLYSALIFGPTFHFFFQARRHQKSFAISYLQQITEETLGYPMFFFLRISSATKHEFHRGSLVCHNVIFARVKSWATHLRQRQNYYQCIFTMR